MMTEKEVREMVSEKIKFQEEHYVAFGKILEPAMKEWLEYLHPKMVKEFTAWKKNYQDKANELTFWDKLFSFLLETWDTLNKKLVYWHYYWEEFTAFLSERKLNSIIVLELLKGEGLQPENVLKDLSEKSKSFGKLWIEIISYSMVENEMKLTKLVPDVSRLSEEDREHIEDAKNQLFMAIGAMNGLERDTFIRMVENALFTGISDTISLPWNLRLDINKIERKLIVKNDFQEEK